MHLKLLIHFLICWMLPRAAFSPMEGHMWPAGRSLPTPGVGENRTNTRLFTPTLFTRCIQEETFPTMHYSFYLKTTNTLFRKRDNDTRCTTPPPHILPTSPLSPAILFGGILPIGRLQIQSISLRLLQMNTQMHFIYW